MAGAFGYGGGGGTGGTGAGSTDLLRELIDLLKTQRPIQVNPAPGMSETTLAKSTASELMWTGKG
ncbi:hypothetical protein D3C73_1609510 [compost metagenome]